MKVSRGVKILFGEWENGREELWAREEGEMAREVWVRVGMGEVGVRGLVGEGVVADQCDRERGRGSVDEGSVEE